MSAIGGRYEYDVFFSYSWASETGDPSYRNWCRAAIRDIATLLSQRFNVGGRRMRYYLDESEMRSAEPLSDTLRKAVERSAVLVALVDEHYTGEYCNAESRWFTEQLSAEGGSVGDHVCVLRTKRIADAAWPLQLTGPDGRPLTYLDLCDDDGPLGMIEFIVGLPRAGLAQPILRAAIDIGAKISTIKTRVAARAIFEASQLPADRRIWFFEGEKLDQRRWDELRHVLGTRGIVLPVGGPLPAGATAEVRATLGDCDGLVMLRSRADDNIGLRIIRAYKDRRQLLTADKDVKWALLDDLDSPPPEGEAFKIPRVRTEGEWMEALEAALRA